MGEIWGLLAIILIFILAIAGIVMRGNRNAKIKTKRHQLHQMVDKQDGFKSSHFLIKFPSRSILDPGKPVGIAIDDQSKQVCLINGKSLKFINYTDIIESEIIVGGSAITKTSRASQFAGAAVGGLLLGGVGAVIGGLSGKKVTGQDVKDVLLKLLINDTSNPVHAIEFYRDNNNGQQTESKIALLEAQKWHALVSVIIRQAEQEVESKSAVQPGTFQASFAEQIYQLSELYKSGVLTVEEFANAKKKILG